MGFHIQEKSIVTDIWVLAHSPWVVGPVQSSRVSELVRTIEASADRWTFACPGHFRIVTDDGKPVSRWKVWPGRHRSLRRRY